MNPEEEGAVDYVVIAAASANGRVVRQGRRGLHGRQLTAAAAALKVVHISWLR